MLIPLFLHGKLPKTIRVIHTYPSGASEPAVVYKEPLFVEEHIDFLMNVFIRGAPIEKNIASKCIRTVAAMYGCKILQLCEYVANVYGYDVNCE